MQISIFIDPEKSIYFMLQIVWGKKLLFIVFAVFLLVSCGTTSAASIITPSTVSEYPSAFIQPYSGTGLASPVPIGYMQNLPTYSDILPQYTPTSPSYVPITSPVYKPVEILAPVNSLYSDTNIPLYSPISLPDYGSYTPATPVIPSSNPGSSQSRVPDSEPDTPSSTVPAFSNPISSGTILIDNMFPRGLGELNIQNARTDKDAVAILVRSGSLEPLIAVYIEAGEKNTMKGILDGNYILYYTLGQEWDPVARQFNRNAEYYRSSSVMSYTTTSKTTRTQFEWSWTVYDVTIGYGDSHPVTVGKTGFPAL
jgi:hypothetical protein